MSLVLASASPRRAKILSSLGIDFAVSPTGAPEVSLPHDPAGTVVRNALAKGAACKAAAGVQGDNVLSADTIVWHDGKIYGKPRDIDEAKSFLRELSGKTHRVYTGVALDGEAKCETSEVRFKSLDPAQIDAYVAAVNPLDRAGAYDIDESGGAVVEGWSGSYENIMGLPVEPLVEWGLVPGVAPVGFFDSGEGGRAIMDAFLSLCPRQKVFYVADRENFPYGAKSRDEIFRLSLASTEKLLAKGCGTIVVACNTATSAAIDHLRDMFPEVPFVGVEPAVKPAAAMSKTGRIGVLATAGTLAGERFGGICRKFAGGVEVVSVAAGELVELSERGETEGFAVEAAVRKRVEPLLDAGCDAIVLGCTHFIRLAPVVRKIVSGRAHVVDPAKAVARQIVRVIASRAVRAGQPAV